MPPSRASRAQNLIFRFLQNVRAVAQPLHDLAPCRRQAPPMRAVPLHPVPTPASQKTRVQIWLFENTDMRIEGRIIVSCLPWTAGLRGRACLLRLR